MWQVFESQDGSTSVFSEKFGIGYHSKYGAVRESRHVFIEAGLFSKCISKKQLSILEIGFGTGLNTLLTYLEAERIGLQIDYTTIEPFPLPSEIVSQLNFLEKLACPPQVFNQLHRAEWGAQTAIAPFFTLKKIEEDIRQFEFTGKYDLIYFDVFSPNIQPELWQAPLLEKCYESLLPGGVMVTYSAKGTFKRTLRDIGFKVETLKGPPGKREMTRAQRHF